MKKSIIGALVGDIVGSRFEWKNCYSKEFELFADLCRPTDDSILTLAIGEALLFYRQEGGDLSEQAVRAMREWGNAYPDAGYGGKFVDWLESDGPQPYNSWGNGAAMRVSPCGWAARSLDEAHTFSDAVTRVTHDHPEGMAGARVVAGCVFLAKSGKSKDEIRKYIETTYRRIDFTLDAIRPTYAPPGTFHVSCQRSVPQALAAFLETDSFEDTIRNAISIGGDSDTIAAIAGSVASAYFGVPEEIYLRTESYLDAEQKHALELCEEAWTLGVE
jgi:type I restriction enzyme M protein